LSTTIHIMVDALGNPVGVCPSGGQANQLVGAAEHGGRDADRR
jgi:hypothetical protein